MGEPGLLVVGELACDLVDGPHDPYGEFARMLKLAMPATNPGVLSVFRRRGSGSRCAGQPGSSPGCCPRSTRPGPSPARTPTPLPRSHSRSPEASAARSACRGLASSRCQALTRRGVGRSQPADVEHPGQSAARNEDVALDEVAVRHHVGRYSQPTAASAIRRASHGPLCPTLAKGRASTDGAHCDLIVLAVAGDRDALDEVMVTCASWRSATAGPGSVGDAEPGTRPGADRQKRPETLASVAFRWWNTESRETPDPIPDGHPPN